MLNDAKNKFQCRLIYLFALLASLGIAPFCVIRYLNGQPIHALVDFAIFAIAVNNAAITYIRKTPSKILSMFTAYLYSLGAVTVAYLNEPIFVFWIFPSLVANFFLLTTRAALLLNVLVIVSIIPIALSMPSFTHSFAMLSSLFITASMTYVFSLLSQNQRSLLQGFATQDALTKLGNRRAMNEEMRLCIEDHQRNQTPATLIVFDLDFFKQVNDEFGHSVGDELLVSVANLLLNRTRKTDRLFRFGGEEFVVLARTTELPDALLIAEQLRAQIEATLVLSDRSVTASFGCAMLMDDDTIESWFDRADKAVYQAKQQGRNCVVQAA